jgi:hypothetical protein
MFTTVSRSITFFFWESKLLEKGAGQKNIDREKWRGLFWLNFEAFSAAVMG